jgi:hypothetical protein
MRVTSAEVTLAINAPEFRTTGHPFHESKYPEDHVACRQTRTASYGFIFENTPEFPADGHEPSPDEAFGVVAGSSQSHNLGPESPEIEMER